MSSPSFILANETNHELLRSLLEGMNAIIDHQYECRFDCKIHSSICTNVHAKLIPRSSTRSSGHKKDSTLYETSSKKGVNQSWTIWQQHENKQKKKHEYEVP